MTITKDKKSYNDYTVSVSWGQLMAIKRALDAGPAGPVESELLAGLDWYVSNALPGPGESEEDLAKAEKAEDEAIEGGPQSADDLLPMPGEKAGAEGGAEPETPEGPASTEKEPESSELDRRLPAPPALPAE